MAFPATGEVSEDALSVIGKRAGGGHRWCIDSPVIDTLTQRARGCLAYAGLKPGGAKRRLAAGRTPGGASSLEAQPPLAPSGCMWQIILVDAEAAYVHSCMNFGQIKGFVELAETVET